jgi:hypothetical protein
MDGGRSLNLLSNLLNPQTEESVDNDLDTITSPYLHPGSIGLPNDTTTQCSEGANNTGNDEGKPHEKDIWSEDEVKEKEELYHNDDDNRQQPSYQIMFKQSVGTEDIFNIGSSLKTPLTAACDSLILRITLPDTKFNDVELDLTEKYVNCSTPAYHLGLYLPHTVDPNSSKARWLTDESVLEITLKVVREYDFLNKI